MKKNFAANLQIGAKIASSVNRVFGGINSKIKQQEATLKKLRTAYRDAGRGTGEYVGKLDVLQREIDQTEAKLKRLRAASKIDFGKVGSAFGSDMKRLTMGAGAAVGAIAAVGASIYSVTRGFVDWADDIGDSAEALQMSTQALQTWQFAAATVGVGGSKMTASIARLSKAISEGTADTVETLAKLGVNAERLKKLGLDQQLEVIAEAFKGYKGTDRAAVAMKLFGRSGYQLAGILAKGKQGLDEFRKAGEETGAILNDEAAEAAGKAAAALDMFGITMIGLRNTIAISFVPTLTRLADRFTKLVRDNGPQIREWATKFAAMIETRVVPALLTMLDKLPGVITEASKFAGKLYDMAAAVADFVGGWDNLAIALVVANFAPTIAAVLSMAKALWGLGAAAWGATGPIGLVIAAIAALSVAIYDLSQENSRIYNWLTETFPNGMREVEDYLAWHVGTLQKIYGTMFDAVKSGYTGLTTAADGAFEKMGYAAGIAAGRIREKFDALHAWMRENFPGATQAMEGAFESLSAKLKASHASMIEVLKEGYPGLLERVDHTFERMGYFATSAAQAIREAFDSVLGWLIAKFDALSAKVSGMFEAARGLKDGVMGLFGYEPTPATVAPFEKADAKESKPWREVQIAPPESMPGRAANITQTNDFRITVNAPGADGKRIAEGIRNEIQRKPLFDSDGALVPAN